MNDLLDPTVIIKPPTFDQLVTDLRNRERAVLRCDAVILAKQEARTEAVAAMAVAKEALRIALGSE